MTLKIVILLALVALSYGLPAADPLENSELNSQAVIQAPDTVDGLFDELFSVGVREATLVLEANDGVETSSRQKRMAACRTVQARSRSGRTVTYRKC